MIKSLESGDFMNLRHLQFFVKLAQTQHMAKAAEALGISQPSLSYAIASLEKELGVPLFEKDGRNIKLTNYGKVYLQYVEQSLNDLKQGSEYISELLDINTGHINLGFTFTMGQDLVPQLVHEFKKDDKQKNITFSYKQDTTTHLINLLLSDKLDLVFASKPQKEDIINQVNYYHLVDQEMKVAVPLNHPLANKASVSLSELKPYSFILYSDKSGLRPRLNRILNKANFTPKVKLEAVEDHTIIGFVHWGFGIAIVPNLPQLDNQYVKLLHFNEKLATHPIYAITKANHFLTPSLSKFQEFAQNYCKRNYIDQGKLMGL